MDVPKTISLLERKMNQELNERLTKIGLSNAQSRLLKHLYNKGEMTQADLCRELEVDKSTIAKKLARMENSGLISKTVNPEDTRSFLVSPTEKALEIIPKTQEILSGWTNDVTVGMTEQEKQLFFKLLHHVAQNAVAICNQNDADEK